MLHWTLIRAFNPRLLEEIRALWLEDPQRNPFVAPSFLEVMAASAEGRGRIPLLAIARFSNATLAAVWPLLLDRGALRFLQPAFSDQRTCLSHPELGASHVAGGLAYAVRETSPTAVPLTSLPALGATLSAARGAFEQLARPHRASAAYPRPLFPAGSR